MTVGELNNLPSRSAALTYAGVALYKIGTILPEVVPPVGLYS